MKPSAEGGFKLNGWRLGLVLLFLLWVPAGCQNNPPASTRIASSPTPPITSTVGTALVTPTARPTVTQIPATATAEIIPTAIISDDIIELDIEGSCEHGFGYGSTVAASGQHVFYIGDGPELWYFAIDSVVDVKSATLEQVPLDSGFEPFVMSTMASNGYLAVASRGGKIAIVDGGSASVVKYLVQSFSFPRAISLSPDGTWLGISHWEREHSADGAVLNLINLTTGEEQWITGDGDSVSAPIWAPDSHRFLVAHFDQDNLFSRLEVRDLGQSPAIELSRRGDCHGDAAWSSAGTQILIADNNLDQSIRLLLVDRETLAEQSVFDDTNQDCCALFLPADQFDKQRPILFIREELYTPPDGSNFGAICQVHLENRQADCPFYPLDDLMSVLVLPGSDALGLLTWELAGDHIELASFSIFEPDAS